MADWGRVREILFSGIRISELERRTGINRKALDVYKADPCRIPLGRLQQLCDAIGISMNEVADLMTKKPLCLDRRPCFARLEGRCRILMEAYERDGECPFCKRRKEDRPTHKKPERQESQFRHGWGA